MIRALRSIFSPFLPSHFTSQNPNLISTHSSIPRRRRKTNPKSPPPPPAQSEISAAVANLPPRFTSSDLSSAINLLPNPRLSLPLLHSTLHLLRRADPSASSPFLAAINRLGNSGHYLEMDSAASLAFSFPSLPLPEEFFNSLIHFYSRARWIPKAIGVYKFMISSKFAARPSARTFNLLFAAILTHRGANSYIHYLYMDALRSLFRQMEGFGVAPDIQSLNFMIKGYVLSLHVNDALRIFHQMVKIYGVEPDGYTYSYLVHGLCSQGRTRNAKEMFGEMRGRGLVPTGRAWNSIVSLLAMAGEVEEAVEIMWEGVGVRRCPDFVTCRTVVEEICRRGRVSEAVVLLTEMRRKEVIDGRCHKELLAGLGEEICD